ncbi:DUF2267 domain-containing protein [soil metagenome]|jgi:uncharacterized protein (DUF2267 family)
MQYQEFVNRVNEQMQTEAPGDAELAIQATLSTLGQRISGGEANNLAAQLPAELQTQLESGNQAEEAEPFSLDEFYLRVAEKEGSSSTDAAVEHARAVMQQLTRAVSGGELADIQRQLPEEFEPLFNKRS